MPQRKRIPGRKRGVTGWMLLTLGLLVAGVWVWSSRTLLSFSDDKRAVWIANGLFGVSLLDKPDARFANGWTTTKLTPFGGWEWTTSGNVSHPGLLSKTDLWLFSFELCKAVKYGPNEFVACRTALIAPWPIAILLWTPAALLLRSGIVARRRALTGKCKACGYDLAGLRSAADARCPECGKVV